MQVRTSKNLDRVLIFVIICLVGLWGWVEEKEWEEWVNQPWVVSNDPEPHPTWEWEKVRKFHGENVFWWDEQRHAWVFRRNGKVCKAFAFLNKKKKGVQSTPTSHAID
jgi:hypothetical protein